MHIGIIGSGTMGRTLGELWAKTGHDILFGSRDPQRVAEWLATTGVAAGHGTYADAVAFGDAVLLATHWEETQAAIEAAGALDGKLLIDCTNPELSNPYRLAVGHTTSGAESIAGWAQGAKVVKAFNHIYGSLLRAGATFGEQQIGLRFLRRGEIPQVKRVALEHDSGRAFKAALPLLDETE